MVLILLGAAVVSFVLALFEEGEDRVTGKYQTSITDITFVGVDYKPMMFIHHW
jgi:hypothetical protein